MNLNLHKPFAFQVMAKPIGSVCNLNCTYCYYLEKQKLYPGTHDFRMNDEVLENFIKQYITTQDVPVIDFVWQGGEPSLLGLDYFKKALGLQKKYAGTKQINNAFQTNGTLLNDEWCLFFKENSFLVGISIDGPEHVHDHHRPFKTGKPTFSQVMQGVDLLKKHKVDFNTLSVVNRYSSQYPLEVYDFLKRIGSGYLQFLPVVERRLTSPVQNELELVHAGIEKASVTDWSVLPEDYATFLITIFKQWVKRDVGRYYVQLFDATLANWVGENAGLCVFSEKCGDSIVMEHNGDVYSCDHYVYPEFLLGNIGEKTLYSMVRSESQKRFGSAKLDTLPNQCISCEYRFACHGECPKHRFEYTEEGQAGLNYFCKTYKKFFPHVHPYMQFMAEELANKRPPSNVMAWAKKIRL
jgi:uncharacterized protein